MEEKNFNQMINNNTFINFFSDASAEILTIQGNIVYSLHECLNMSSDKALDAYLKIMKAVYKPKINKCKTREEKIKVLEKNIPDAFLEYLEDVANVNIFKIMDEAIKNNNKISGFNIVLSTSGYMYSFNENNRTYIIPNELLDIYKDYIKSDKKHERDMEKTKDCIFSYLIMNCLVPIDWFQDVIINHYNYLVTKKDIKNIIEAMGIEIYKNKYYCLLELHNYDDNSTLLDSLLTIKNENQYLILDEEKLFDYIHFINSFCFKISRIIGNNDNLMDSILNSLAMYHVDGIDNIEEQLNFYKIPSKKQKKVLEIINENIDKIRLWYLNGKTYEECNIEDTIKDNTFVKLPNSLDLKSCLKNLDKENLEFLLETYEAKDINSLTEILLLNFEKTLNNIPLINFLPLLDEEYAIEDIGSLNAELYKYLFFYNDNKKLKIIVPLEYKKVIEEKMKFIDYDEYVTGYILINGVIENKKLQELLKEYHDIDISLKELDSIAKNNDFKIVDKKYYTAIEDMEIKEVLKYMSIKERAGQYKKLDLDQLAKTQEFEDEMEELVTREVNSNPETLGFILFLAENGGLNKDILESFNEEGISINSKAIKLILELYKKYKKDISCWPFNGYSITEYQELRQTKNKKVGRNEPCPCGSGKKYKHCCGK